MQITPDHVRQLRAHLGDAIYDWMECKDYPITEDDVMLAVIQCLASTMVAHKGDQAANFEWVMRNLTTALQQLGSTGIRVFTSIDGGRA